MNQTPPQTLYDVLGLDYRTCEFADIKKAYRTQARMHHPDRVKAENKEESTKIFRQLTEAYEILSDGPKKLRYDSAMGLYRKRNSRVEEEAGNYFNKNMVGKNFRRPSGEFDVEAGTKKNGNFFTNAVGKMRKGKRPKEVAPNKNTGKKPHYYGSQTSFQDPEDTKEPINDKQQTPTSTPTPASTQAKRKCPILPTFQINGCVKPTSRIKGCFSKCGECCSDCRMLFSFEELDSITIFAMVSVIGGSIFFIAVLVVLTVVHVI